MSSLKCLTTVDLTTLIESSLKRADAVAETAAETEREVEIAAIDSELAEELGFDDSSIQKREETIQLEAILESLAEVSPEARDHFMDLLEQKLAVKHYGLSEIVPQNGAMVPYAQIRDQLLNTKKKLLDAENKLLNISKTARIITQSLPIRIKGYISLQPASKEYRNNLKFLAKAAILDSQDTRIYLAALKVVDRVYNQPSLKSLDSYVLRRGLKFLARIDSAIIGAVTSTALLFPSISTEIVYYGSIFFIFINGVTAIGYNTPSPNAKEDRHAYFNEALARHASRYADRLPRALTDTLDYAKKLQAQLENPSSVDLNYSRRLAELSIGMDRARFYFHSMIPLFEDIHSMKHLFEKLK